MAATTEQVRERGATRGVEDHATGVGRQIYVCYSCKHHETFLADCGGEACKGMLAGVCPRCGEQNA